MGDIIITLETLYDILRNEKKREDLQQLGLTFFKDVVGYLQEKEALMKSKRESSDVFALTELDKLEYELKNIRRILREIYEKREKKIMDIALNKSRTGSNIIDTSAMLSEEKEFYERVLLILDKFRRNILHNVCAGKLPEIAEFRSASDMELRKEQLRQELETVTATHTTVAGTTIPPSRMIRIKFLHPVPSFVWKDLKEYGPYEAGEETEIYSEVAELIVRKGRAEKA